MNHLQDIIKLVRPKHWIKNILVFIPIFFSHETPPSQLLYFCILAFLSFSFISSAIYVINDIIDIEADKQHPTKRNRPLASGRIFKSQATIILAICLVISVLTTLYICYTIENIAPALVVLTYFILNIAYSLYLKQVPIIDVGILASGFFLRVLMGSFVTSTPLSEWMYLVVIFGSLFLGLGKRRNETKNIDQNQASTRKSLDKYNYNFLDKNMYLCLSATIVFYCLWCTNVDMTYLISLPIFIYIMMRYSLIVEGESDGDPVEVLSHDMGLKVSAVIYIIAMVMLLYF